MQKGTIIKAAVISALLVVSVTGLSIHAEQPIAQEGEPVIKTESRVKIKEKTIKEKSEQFKPIRPVPVMPKKEEEVIASNEPEGLLHTADAEGETSEAGGTAGEQPVDNAEPEEIPGDDSGADGGTGSNIEDNIEETVEPAAEEEYYEPEPETEYVEEPTVAEEVPQEETSNDDGWTYYGNCRITHYDWDSCCCGVWSWGPTASGVNPTEGWTVANGSLPFGTIVMIDGHEYCVEDRGVGGDQFDVFVGSHDEAMARGMYYADVYIKE